MAFDKRCVVYYVNLPLILTNLFDSFWNVARLVVLCHLQLQLVVVVNFSQGCNDFAVAIAKFLKNLTRRLKPRNKIL